MIFRKIFSENIISNDSEAVIYSFAVIDKATFLQKLLVYQLPLFGG